VAGVSVHAVVMAAEGAAARSVRACKPGRCPAAVLLPETLAGLGPGVLRPASSRAFSSRLLHWQALWLRPVGEGQEEWSVDWVGLDGCEPRHLRRRALQLQPVGQILELAACVLLVMGKAMARKGRWRQCVSAVMTTMWALSTS
jgi:hypothetical protein